MIYRLTKSFTSTFDDMFDLHEELVLDYGCRVVLPPCQGARLGRNPYCLCETIQEQPNGGSTAMAIHNNSDERLRARLISIAKLCRG